MRHIACAAATAALCGTAFGGVQTASFQLGVSWAGGQFVGDATELSDAIETLPDGSVRFSGSISDDLGSWTADWSVVAFNGETDAPGRGTAMMAETSFIVDSFTITNTTGAAESYDITVTQPATAVLAPTVIAGSVSANVVATQPGTASLSVPAGEALYSSLIDGATVAQMVLGERQVVAPFPLVSDLPSEDFGSVAPVGVASDVGIRWRFDLSADARAQISGTFVATGLVPGPGAAGVLAIAGAALLRRRRD